MNYLGRDTRPSLGLQGLPHWRFFFLGFIFFMVGMDEAVLGKYLGCSAQAFIYTGKVSGKTLVTDFRTATAKGPSPHDGGLLLTVRTFIL